MHFTATIETDNADAFTDEQLEAAIDALSHVAGAIATSSHGNREATITLPADTIAQAAQLALTTVTPILGGDVLRFEILPEETADARRDDVDIPELVTITEAAEILGTSRQAVHKRVRSGSIPSVRIGNSQTFAIVKSSLAPAS